VITGSGPYDLGKWKDRGKVEKSTKPVKESISASKLATAAAPPRKPPVQPPPLPKVAPQPTQPVKSTKAAKSTVRLKTLHRNSRIIGEMLPFQPSQKISDVSSS
jgi:hypothetical protein